MLNVGEKIGKSFSSEDGEDNVEMGDWTQIEESIVVEGKPRSECRRILIQTTRGMKYCRKLVTGRGEVHVEEVVGFQDAPGSVEDVERNQLTHRKEPSRSIMMIS